MKKANVMDANNFCSDVWNDKDIMRGKYDDYNLN